MVKGVMVGPDSLSVPGPQSTRAPGSSSTSTTRSARERAGEQLLGLVSKLETGRSEGRGHGTKRA